VPHIGAVCYGAAAVSVDNVVLVAARRVSEDESGAGIAVDNVAGDEAAGGAGQSVATIADNLEPGNLTVGAKADRFSRELGNRAIDDRYAGIARSVDSATIGSAGPMIEKPFRLIVTLLTPLLTRIAEALENPKVRLAPRK
jgi:hypothetical protein